MFRRRFLSLLFCGVFVLGQTPVHVFASEAPLTPAEQALEDQRANAEKAYFLSIANFLPMATGIFSRMTSAVPQAGALLGQAYGQLQSGTFNLQNLVGGAASGICNNIVGSVTSQISQFTGPLTEYADTVAGIASIQDVQSLLPSLASAAGFQNDMLDSALSQGQNLLGSIADPNKAKDVLFDLTESKITSAVISNDRIGQLTGFISNSGNQLGGLNTNFNNLIQTIGNPDVIGTTLNTLGESALGAKVTELQGQVTNLDNLTNSYVNELIPDINSIEGLVQSSDIPAAISQVTALEATATSQLTAVTGSITSQTSLLDTATSELQVLENFDQTAILTNFGNPAIVDPAEKLIDATQQYTNVRVAKLDEVTGLQNQLTDLVGQKSFIEDKLGKYTSFLDVAGQFPSPTGEMQSALLEATSGFRADIDGSLGLMSSTKDSLLGSVSSLQGELTSFVGGQLPVEEVMQKIQLGEGFVSELVDTKLGPIQDMAGEYLGFLTDSQGFISQGIGSFVSSISDKINLGGAIETDFLSGVGGDFFGPLQDQLGVLNGQLGGLTSQLNSVIGPVQSALGDLSSASGICDFAIGNLSGLLSNFNFTDITGFVGNFFGGIQGDIGGFTNGIVSQIQGGINLSGLCNGLPVQIPVVCGVSIAPVSLSTLQSTEAKVAKARKKKRKAKGRKKNQFKRCCRKFDNGIPQCENRKSLQCVAPDESMNSLRGGKGCFKTFSKKTKQCIRKGGDEGGSGGTGDVVLPPSLDTVLPDPTSVTTIESAQKAFDDVDNWRETFIDAAKKNPRATIDYMSEEMFGYKAFERLEQLEVQLNDFVNDPRYQQYKD